MSLIETLRPSADLVGSAISRIAEFRSGFHCSPLEIRSDGDRSGLALLDFVHGRLKLGFSVLGRGFDALAHGSDWNGGQGGASRECRYRRLNHQQRQQYAQGEHGCLKSFMPGLR